MRTLPLTLLALVGTAALIAGPASRVDAQGQTIKIGVLYDHTGPFSAAGSLDCWRGAKMIIDYVNEHGGVLGRYTLVQVDGDSQSKAEVAINEAERLLNVEKVDILAGVYSSAHAVSLAENRNLVLHGLVVRRHEVGRVEEHLLVAAGQLGRLRAVHDGPCSELDEACVR